MPGPKTIWIDVAGKSFQVFIGANGLFYLHDPEGELDAPHLALPTKERSVSQDGRLGASAEGAVAMNLVPTALSFVPVIGPVLGPLASVLAPIIGNMFGGNDPTPADQLVQKVVSLRQQILQLNQQLGIPDQMPTLTRQYKHPYDALPMILELWPSNASIDDNNHWTCDWSGVNCDGCGNMRKCLYAAIMKLTPIFQGKQQELQAKQQASLVQNIAKAVAPSVATPPPSTTPVTVPNGYGATAPVIYTGGPINYGTPTTNPFGIATTLPSAAPPPAPVATAGFGSGWLLPLLLVGFPVTMGLVMGSGAPPPQAPVRKRRHAA